MFTIVVQELRLDSNEIGANGGLAVANAMVNKENLKVLNLDGNQFGECWEPWGVCGGVGKLWVGITVLGDKEGVGALI